MRFIDLSWPLNQKVPIYPGDPELEISVFSTIDSIGYNLFNLRLGTQTGTHVDAPYHFCYDKDTIDKIELEYFFGEGIIVDVTEKSSFYEIPIEDILPYDDAITESGIVLIKTDWYKTIGTKTYREHPYLSMDVANYLVEKKVRTVCVDTLNADITGGTYFPVHLLFAEKRIMVAENMCNFDKIDLKNPIISLFPLNLEGCDGAPIRAVAIDLKKQ